MQGCWKKFAYCECLLVEHCCHTISGSFSQLLGSDEEMAVAHYKVLAEVAESLPGKATSQVMPFVSLVVNINA